MKKTLIGNVVSTKMNKTVVVEVVRKLTHSKYKKVITSNKKYKVHNDEFELVVGDRVSIVETRPISKDKHFKVIEKLKS